MKNISEYKIRGVHEVRMTTKSQSEPVGVYLGKRNVKKKKR